MDYMKEIVMPFIRVTSDCFNSMVGIKLDIGSCEKVKNHYKAVGMYSMISFTGDLNGQIAISFSKKTALKVFSLFLEEAVMDIDDESLDAAGEIINIIAGGKSYIANYNMSMSLPSVLVGNPMLIALPRDVPVVKTVFTSPKLGDVTLLVALKEAAV